VHRFGYLPTSVRTPQFIGDLFNHFPDRTIKIRADTEPDTFSMHQLKISAWYEALSARNRAHPQIRRKSLKCGGRANPTTSAPAL
jgi:hypothetical protein